MQVNCSYTYKGKQFSKDRLLRKLVEELPINSQSESIEFLNKYLNMSEREITIVKGLIGGRSLGRLQQDGNILLSEFSDIRTAKHEAFHRVWRMYLTPEERTEAIRTFKNKKNWKDLIDPYRPLYPNQSENDLIEELFADDFSDFVIQPDTYINNQPLLNFFQRIYNFIKQILGLSNKDITKIYQRILNKEFIYPPAFENPYAVDQTIIAGTEFTVAEKQELIATATQQFIKNLINSNLDTESVLDIPKTRLDNLLEVVSYDIVNSMIDVAESTNDDRLASHANAVYEDFQKVSTDESVIWSGVKKMISTLGLTIEDQDGEVLDSDTDKTREFTPTIEVDPYSGIAVKLKLLLASFTKGFPTENYKFDTPVNPIQEFLNIATKMAGTPTSEFMTKLNSIGLPYAAELYKILESNVDFRNKFISQLSMTINSLYVYELGDDGKSYLFNANQNTVENKLVRNWQSNAVSQIEDFNKWVGIIESLNTSRNSDQVKLERLGIVVDDRVIATTLVNTIYTTLLSTTKNANFEVNYANFYKSLGIDGYVKDLARLQSEFEAPTNLMVQLGDKKLYPLNLNTQQTILLNQVRFAQSQFTEDMSINQKLDILTKYAPFITSDYHLSRNGDKILIHNKWLEQILSGKQVNLVVPYILQTKSGGQSEISDLDESDLVALHINGSLSGVTMSMKHSDRSTFFAYKLDPLYSKKDATSVNNLLDKLTTDIIGAIQNEVRITNKIRNSNINVQYISRSKPPRGFEELLGTRSEEIFNGAPILASDIFAVRNVVNTKFEEFKTYLQDLGIDLNKAIHSEYIRDFNNMDLLLATAFTNEAANHIYESMTFSGDLRVFKDGNDLFKRLSPQSSTGQLVVTDARTNDYIKQQLNRVEKIFNPKTGQVEEINTAATLPQDLSLFRSITLAEEESYKSNLLDPVLVNGQPLISKLTGNPESKIFMIYEYNFLQDEEIRSKASDAELIKKIQLYESKYARLNENDGQSYMSLPAFKQMQIRLGNWNKGFEIIYKIEMAIAQFSNLEDARNLEIEYAPGKTFKPFEQSDFLNPMLDGKKVKLEPIHTLKTQFAGYSIPESLVDSETVNLWFNTVLKTSQHIVTPSHIIGTNLQMMNRTMLVNGIDIIHMGSANKVGGVDPKLAAINNLANNPLSETLPVVAKDGLQFYNSDGEFNDNAISEHINLFSYLASWEYLKDQVRIGNKVKDEIKGSTQSLKIVVSNLMSNGTERIENARQMIKQYASTIDEMLLNRRTEFFNEIGYDGQFNDLNKLKEVVLSSTQIKSAPDNIVNSVINLFDDIELGIESSPMKNKIENVLYALVTNNVISFDRSGTAMPIAASTGYEPFGSRKELRSGPLKFYDAVFNDQGEITKVTPAEMIMPLPPYWIKPLMKWAQANYNTTNLIDAINLLNKRLAQQEFLVKGLRIPNQQLSSNDIYKLVKFNLPTFTNYAIVPSETVAKVGED